MGGNLAVTLRDESGMEHRMCRWTNIFPHYVTNVKLYNKDPSHMDEFLGGWYRMLRDYKENKKTKNFFYPMTECYASHPYLAPEQYGLVVIDFKTNVILELQGYTSFERVELFEFLFQDPDYKQRIEALFAAKRITRLEVLGKPKENTIKKPTLEQALIKDVGGYRSCFIDTSPFKVIKYQESLAGAKKLYKDIKKLGFKLSLKEEKLWQQWFNRQKEHE